MTREFGGGSGIVDGHGGRVPLVIRSKIVESNRDGWEFGVSVPRHVI